MSPTLSWSQGEHEHGAGHSCYYEDSGNCVICKSRWSSSTVFFLNQAWSMTDRDQCISECEVYLGYQDTKMELIWGTLGCIQAGQVLAAQAALVSGSFLYPYPSSARRCWPGPSAELSWANCGWKWRQEASDQVSAALTTSSWSGSPWKVTSGSRFPCRFFWHGFKQLI